jgi:hypothetical protein
MKMLLVGFAFVSQLASPGVSRSQDSLRVVPGWGLDTSSTGSGDYTTQGPVPEIFKAWRNYLRSDAMSQSPTRYWSAAEQRKWPRYDVAGGYAYQGLPATVLSIELAQPGATEYTVRTLFSTTDGPANDVKPTALMRVYAIRENGQWVFANALPRLTHDWQRHKVGPINYIVQPGHRFDEEKAKSAARFADSVAKMFGVNPLTALDYYVADTPEEIHRILGLDFVVGAGAQASYSDPGRQMIFVGSSVFGENHRHELTHSILASLTWTANTASIVNEGTATWLGGSLGKSFPDVMKEYAGFLAAHPTITLDSVFTVTDHDLGQRPAGAALVEMTYQHGGIPGLKAVMASGRTPAQVRTALEKNLGMSWPEIERAWRSHILEYASTPVGKK